MTKMEKGELRDVLEERRRLKQILSVHDFEYMVWQEWKEGFARLIENRIRGRLRLQENHRGKEQPFNRVVFYEGGANFIRILEMEDSQSTLNIERLFDRMSQG